jgi:hypothetical protein
VVALVEQDGLVDADLLAQEFVDRQLRCDS